MEEPDEKPKPNKVEELKQSLRKWAMDENDKEREAEIDKLLKDAGVKPHPDEPANPS
ncbi:hypothetical protein ACFST9_04165 [Hymenobacter monticola]|uniref:Uncharacterized protein n=1 Tax=Hymenobacter monticola TaxID=1705399 RepID=A0ABY4B564_9BACT|nr:hypothetical protein [Hymenobacter monticola]UOE32851.1 hypothetical protein MTP16_17155 [Hymenobacter monticola]